MRSIALLLVGATACTTPQARKAHHAGEVAAAGGLIGMLGAGLGAAAVPSHDQDILTVGLAFVPISVIGALVYIATDEKANEDHHGPVLTRRERRRAEAWELTKQAASAARERDCAQVEAIDPRVRDLDTEFHGVVFMRDAAIQRCLRR